jgi:hypothetical protein
MSIQNFNEFQSYNPYNTAALRMNDIFQLDETNNMAKYNMSDFMSMFSGPLFESDGYVNGSILEKAHVYYELSMLNEARSHWFLSESETTTIDAGDHIILVKDSEAYIISSSTYKAMNEDWEFMTFDDYKEAYNELSKKVKQFAKAAVTQVSTTVDKTNKAATKFVGDTVSTVNNANKVAIDSLSNLWDSISIGAKKAWEWCKTAVAAVAKFIQDMTWIDWVSLGLGILGAILGVVGATVPGATVVGGVCMVLNGGLNLYEGWNKYVEAKNAISKIDNVTLISKEAALVSTAVPNAIMGSLFLSLGFHDISHGLSDALVNPAAGSVSLAVHQTGTNVAKSFSANIAKDLEGFMAGFLEPVCKRIFKENLAGHVAEGAADVILTVLGETFLEQTMGWMLKSVLGGGDLILAGIQFLLSLPEKISEGLTLLSKNVTGTIGKIMAEGIKNLIKPMADSAAKVIAKYISPIIQKARTWIQNLIKHYDICREEIQKHQKELGEPQQVPPTKGKPLVKPKVLTASPSDLEKIKKLPNIDKEITKVASATGYHVKSIHEAMIHILPFDQFAI